MLGRVVLVERAALLARLARTPRRYLAVPAGPAVTLARRAKAQRVLTVRMEHPHCVTAVPAALAEPAARVAMQVLAALAAVVLPGRAVAVVWVRQASAALVAVAAQVAPGSMRAA